MCVPSKPYSGYTREKGETSINHIGRKTPVKRFCAFRLSPNRREWGLRRILLLRSLPRFGRAPRGLSRRKQGRSAWSFGHHAVLPSGLLCDSDRPLPRLAASLESIENKGYESLMEVFGPLWLIP
jgi:hypothetical protein